MAFSHKDDRTCWDYDYQKLARLTSHIKGKIIGFAIYRTNKS
jgi:hypothetical protein